MVKLKGFHDYKNKLKPCMWLYMHQYERVLTNLTWKIQIVSISVAIDLITRNTNHNAFMYSVHHLLNATSFPCPNVNNVQQMCQLTDIVLAYKQKPSYNYIREVLHYYTVNAV